VEHSSYFLISVFSVSSVVKYLVFSKLHAKNQLRNKMDAHAKTPGRGDAEKNIHLEILCVYWLLNLGKNFFSMALL